MADQKVFSLKEVLPVRDKWVGKRIQFIARKGPANIPGWGNIGNLPSEPVQIEHMESRMEGLAISLRTVNDFIRPVRFNALPGDVFTVNTPPPVYHEDKDFVAGVVAARAIDPHRYHYLVGADPEVFVTNGRGELFPSFEFLSASADGAQRHQYWDGYQAEFRFPPPDCLDQLVYEIQIGLHAILHAARKKDPAAQLSVKTTWDIPVERLINDDPMHVQFGCNPSLNVYGDSVESVPGAEVPFRSSGGHMHFSVPDGAKNKLIPLMIKELDRILGVITVSMFQNYDDPRRRLLYGRAGEHRLPKYGFEYRVLSSAWMIHPGLVQFVYEAARHIIGYTMYAKAPATWWDVTEEEARTCINNCDVALAHKLLARNKAGLIGLLLAMPISTSSRERRAVETAITMIESGVHKYLRNPDVFSEGWAIHDPGHPRSRTNSRWSSALYALETRSYFD